MDTRRMPGPGLEHAACAICLTEFRPRDKVRYFRCNHTFHQQCIDQWLESKRTCPICRQPVLSSDDPKAVSGIGMAL